MNYLSFTPYRKKRRTEIYRKVGRKKITENLKKKKREWEVRGQQWSGKPKPPSFSSDYFRLYHVKTKEKLSAFAPVDLRLLCFWLCSCKAFSVFSPRRRFREQKQHCASETTSCCNSGSIFFLHINHIYALKQNSHFCFITLSGDTKASVCPGELTPNTFYPLIESWGVCPHSAASPSPFSGASPQSGREYLCGWPSNQPYSLLKSLQDPCLHFCYYLA